MTCLLASPLPEDWIIFFILELFSLFGIFTNILVIITVIAFHHYRKPSFLLILSLAIADMWHCLTTSVYYFLPIALKCNYPFNHGSTLFWNLTDYTAWGITLSHMFGLSMDRFMAVVKYNSYRAGAPLLIISFVLKSLIDVYFHIFFNNKISASNQLIIECECYYIISDFPNLVCKQFNSGSQIWWAWFAHSSAATNVYDGLSLPCESLLFRGCTQIDSIPTDWKAIDCFYHGISAIKREVWQNAIKCFVAEEVYSAPLSCD